LFDGLFDATNNILFGRGAANNNVFDSMLFDSMFRSGAASDDMLWFN
jgi:hypothetical protein